MTEVFTLIVRGMEVSKQFDRSKALFNLEKFTSLPVSAAKSLGAVVSRVRGAKDYNRVKCADSTMILLDAVLGTASNKEKHLNAVERLGHLVNSHGMAEYTATLGVCYTHTPVKASNSVEVFSLTVPEGLALEDVVSARVSELLTSGHASNFNMSVTEKGVVSVSGHHNGVRFAGHNADETNGKVKVSTITKEAQEEGRYARVQRVLSTGKKLSKSDSEFVARYEARLELAA